MRSEQLICDADGGLFSGKKFPRNIGQTFAFSPADTVCILRIETDFSIFVDHLRMKREDHVRLQWHLTFRTNCRVLDHCRTNAVTRKVSQRKTVLRKSVCDRAMNVAG